MPLVWSGTKYGRIDCCESMLFIPQDREANSLTTLQAFSGIGGGGMTTVVSIMFSDIIPLRERGVWQGLINIIYATGAGLGAPLGK
jgi:MFS family permease